MFGKKDDVEQTSMDKYGEPDTAVGYVGDENAMHQSDFVVGDSLYARLQRFAGKFGVEQRGIERVPSDERTDASMSKICTMVRSFCLPIPRPSHLR